MEINFDVSKDSIGDFNKALVDKFIKSEIKGELVDTGRRKLGAIIADNVHTGINTSIFPGRKIWPGLTTRPGESINRDVKEPKDI